ncbi:MAG TPA: NB-ARC domain-containing protein [Allocoleopsis sp.]
MDLTDFTGRQAECDRIMAWLREGAPSEQNAVPISVVTGIAGVGKSALAIHIAHQLQHDFPDAQLYVNLRGTEGQPVAPLDVLAVFLRAWGVDEQSIPDSLTHRAELYRSRLAGKRVLVLLDDAHNEEQVRPLLPNSSTCAVLVTTRRSLADLAESRVLDLTEMAPTDALELLEKQVGQERTQAEPEAAKKIIDLCDRLPLAIRIAGGTLQNKRDWRLEEYALSLAKERRRQEQLHSLNLAVRAALVLNYQELDARAAHLFRLLGLLTGPKFLPSVAVALLESDPVSAEESVTSLVKVKLLEPATDERYRLHDLVRLFAKEQLAQEELAQARQAARLRAGRWYLETSKMMNLALNPQTRRQLAQILSKSQAQPLAATEQNLWLGALNWFKLERTNLLACVDWADQAEAWDIVVGLAENLVNFFNTYAARTDWERTHLLALEATRKLAQSSESHRDTSRQGEAQTLTNLGNLYSLQNHWEKASDCYEQSLGIFSELEERAGVAKALGNLANVYTQQGQWGKASECYKQSLLIFGELKDFYGEAQTLANMGIFYIKQNHEQKAAVLWREALTKLPSGSPKTKQVAQWLELIRPIAQEIQATSPRPPQRRISYVIVGVIIIVAIALVVILLMH